MKLTRHQKRIAKPCYRHKQDGATDGKKIKKARMWYEGAPLTEKKGASGLFSTKYSTKS